MYQRYKERFGTAGLVVGVIALILALGGTALAAKGALTGKQRKEVEKIAKKFQGTGPAGAAGKDGTNGTNGAPGAKGDKGDPGDNGKSVLTTEITTAGLEGKCVGVGGTKVEVEDNAASKKYICNGTNGEDGETGFTSSLPPGETETGAWAARTTKIELTNAGPGQEVLGPGSTIVPLSFNIPLSEAPTALYYVNKEGKEFKIGEGIEYVTPVNCTGSFDEPTAPADTVCVYAEEETLSGPGFYPVVAQYQNLYPSGATFFYFLGEEGVALGSWAVTAAP